MGQLKKLKFVWLREIVKPKRVLEESVELIRFAFLHAIFNVNCQ
jgi:hypothetical protein